MGTSGARFPILPPVERGVMGIDRLPAVNKEKGVRTEIALTKRLTLTVVALGSPAVVSFAHRQIQLGRVAGEGRVGGGYKA